MQARLETLLFRLSLGFLFLLLSWIALRSGCYLCLILTAVVLAGVLFRRHIPEEVREAAAKVFRPAGRVADAVLWPFRPLTIVVIAVALRMLWSQSFDVRLTTDYLAFFEQAKQFSQGDASVLGSGKSPVTVLLYGSFFRLFGAKLVTAQVVNAALGGLQALLVYASARRLFASVTAARLAGTLTAIFPSAVLYANLPSADMVYVAIMLAILWQVVRFVPSLQEMGRIRLLGFAALLGVEVGALHLTRNIGVVTGLWMIAAGLLWTRARRATTLTFAAVTIACLAACLVPQVVYNQQTYGYFSIQSSKWGALNFLSGTNVKSGGEHNDQDTRFLQRQYGFGDEQWAEASRAARERAIARVKHDVAGFLGFALTRKFDTMWCDESYGAGYKGVSRVGGTRVQWKPVSQRFYLALIAAALCGMLVAPLRNARYRPLVVTAAGVLFTMFVLHVFIEVQPRYHFAANFFLPLLAAPLLSPGEATVESEP